MAITSASLPAKKRILTVCVRLFLEKGYKRSTLAEIIEKADVSYSTFQNIFRAKDGVLTELVEFMFSNQFAMARGEAGAKLPPVYVYAVETAIQMTLTELNENLREIYIEAYTEKEASEYIEKYFETYPGIKSFLDGLVENAKKNGYVTTLYGRRRPMPELKSSNFMQRSFGERVAMNAPIQGTAADIIKIAMIHVSERLKKEQLKSRLILQVHDELLIEAEESELEQVKTILREEMQGAAELSVRLEIDMHTGKNWYEAK